MITFANFDKMSKASDLESGSGFSFKDVESPSTTQSMPSLSSSLNLSSSNYMKDSSNRLSNPAEETASQTGMLEVRVVLVVLLVTIASVNGFVLSGTQTIAEALCIRNFFHHVMYRNSGNDI